MGKISLPAGAEYVQMQRTTIIIPTGYWDVVLRESRHELIDVSYWHSLGRGDVYADAMRNLEIIIMDYTVQMYEERMNENENKIIMTRRTETKDTNKKLF